MCDAPLESVFVLFGIGQAELLGLLEIPMNQITVISPTVPVAIDLMGW